MITVSAPMLSILFLQLQICLQKLTMEEFLKRRELITITVSAAEIKWDGDDKEAMINGNYFDVEKISVNKEGEYELTGLFDERETKLKLELDGAAGQKNEERNNIIRNFFSLQGVILKTSVPCSHTVEKKAEKNLYFIPFIPSRIIEVSTPPPWLIEIS